MLDIASQALITHDLWGQRVRVVCCGKPCDWRTGRGKNTTQVAALAQHEQAEDVRLIVPCFGTELAGPERRLDWKDDQRIRFRIAKCDGVYIVPGEAAFIASADCPTIIVEQLDDPNAGIWVIHGGRDCLIDRGALNGGSAREHFSIIDAIFAHEHVHSAPQRFRAYSVLGIKQHRHPLNHSKFGDYNKCMLAHAAREWGDACVASGDCLVLHEVIKGQFAKHGVHQVGTDGIDTHSSEWPCGGADTETFWSAARGDTCRNGVLVINQNR